MANRNTLLGLALTGAVAMAVVAALPITNAPAQQQGALTVMLFNDPDGVTPLTAGLNQIANEIRKAKIPDNPKCMLGRLRIRTPVGDEIFQPTIAAERERQALTALHQMGLPVAGRLFVESTVSGKGGGPNARYEPPDRKPPKLTTISDPPKGTRVKPKQTIRITMVAQDDPEPWPTGIKTMQVVADSEGGRFVASENFEPCTGAVERRVTATYTVPANPPPMVRLTALAEDHAGNMETDVGEFPTQEVWSGSYRLESDSINPSCSKVNSEGQFTIGIADNGEVTGTGTLSHSSWTCQGGFRAPATKGPITLGGRRQGGTITVFLKDVPDMTYTPRLPIGGQWVVQVGQGKTGETTFSQFPGVVYRIRLECRTCGPS